MSDLQEITSAYERHAALLRRTTESNKAALFDALVAAGITTVVVTFDGEGDSGQIEDVRAYVADAEVTLPSAEVPWHVAPWNASEPELTKTALDEAVRDLCWDYLSGEHGGWENNDGGFGEFTLNVAGREVDLEFKARFTDTTHFHHTF
jgi:hypothetical protein